MLNVRSVCNKAHDIHELVIEKEINVLAMTETWLGDHDGPILADLCPTGYTLIHRPRPKSKGERGGGVGLLVSDKVTAEQVQCDEHATFESMEVKLRGRRTTCLVIIYPPPPSKKNTGTTTQFLEELDDYSLCQQETFDYSR